VGLSASAGLLSQASALAPVLVAIIVWGVSAWSFFPAQQARLIGVAGPKLAPVILSLNASFMYLGFSLGAALGSFTLTRGSVADLGLVGALCVLASFALVVVTKRKAPTRTVVLRP
jgi:predicted MFS family arabinose efflux permease